MERFCKNKQNQENIIGFCNSFSFISCDGSKGYISCRRMASQSEIDKYENIYKNMK